MIVNAEVNLEQYVLYKANVEGKASCGNFTKALSNIRVSLAIRAEWSSVTNITVVIEVNLYLFISANDWSCDLIKFVFPWSKLDKGPASYWKDAHVYSFDRWGIIYDVVLEETTLKKCSESDVRGIYVGAVGLINKSMDSEK